MDLQLEHKTKSVWEKYEQEQEEMNRLADEYLNFLSTCKTERETVNWIRSKIQEMGFSEDLSGDKFFRAAKDKTILLARKGKKPLEQGLRILGAHADSPRLDFKQHPLYESCDLALAKTHYYGGIRKHQWLSRPLALHGIVVKTNGQRIEVNIGEKDSDPVFVIADLLPHLAYKQNEEKLDKAFEAEKLNIILGNQPRQKVEQDQPDQDSSEENNNKFKNQILNFLYQKYGLIEEDLFSAEIMAVPAGPARYVGLDQSLLGGYGQDDRICVFSAFKALIQEDVPEYTQIVIFWDKEEIGSEGATGARSLFLEYTLQEVIQVWEPEASLSKVLGGAKAISADVHGALDPDYQDLHDKLNASRLGYGPVFCKFTGHRGKIGANDATAEYVAWLRNKLNQAKIPWQMAELGKVDLGGGGTVAKHLAIYGLDIIDFGPGVLGMHSPFEITSKADLYATYLAYKEFLNS